jgi:hypothetical protein
MWYEMGKGDFCGIEWGLSACLEILLTDVILGKKRRKGKERKGKKYEWERAKTWDVTLVRWLKSKRGKSVLTKQLFSLIPSLITRIKSRFDLQIHEWVNWSDLDSIRSHQSTLQLFCPTVRWSDWKVHDPIGDCDQDQACHGLTILHDQSSVTGDVLPADINSPTSPFGQFQSRFCKSRSRPLMDALTVRIFPPPKHHQEFTNNFS